MLMLENLAITFVELSLSSQGYLSASNHWLKIPMLMQEKPFKQSTGGRTEFCNCFGRRQCHQLLLRKRGLWKQAWKTPLALSTLEGAEDQIPKPNGSSLQLQKSVTCAPRSLLKCILSGSRDIVSHQAKSWGVGGWRKAKGGEGGGEDSPNVLQ